MSKSSNAPSKNINNIPKILRRAKSSIDQVAYMNSGVPDVLCCGHKTGVFRAIEECQKLGIRLPSDKPGGETRVVLTAMTPRGVLHRHMRYSTQQKKFVMIEHWFPRKKFDDREKFFTINETKYLLFLD